MAVIAVVLIGILLLLGVAMLLAFRDDGLSDEPIDYGDLGLPARPLTADDIPALRFRTAVRGYRMEDVDAALERLSEALRDAETTAEK